MGVPKCKTSKANRRMNRGSRCVLDSVALSECPQCHAVKQPHHACPECGYYKGVPVVEKKVQAE